jgi:4-hydroxymandelate oxidase
MPLSRRDALLSAGTLAGAGMVAGRVASADDPPRASTDPVCLTDFEPLAKARVSAMAWEYVNGAAADETTVRWNREAFSRIRLKPQVLNDVSKLDSRLTLYGHQHQFPILLAPTAAHKLMHPEAELATARGAGAAHASFVLSSFSTTRVEDVSAAATTPFWFQLYVQPDRGFTRSLVQRAESAGCSALCLTVDTPTAGARDRETRVKVSFPPLPNLEGAKQAGGEEYRAAENKIYSAILDPTLTWKDVEWLRSFTKVPLLLKGILNPADADRAVQSGAGGIMVSNHGGRNLDTVPATIDALPLITEKIAGRVPILMDGGIRRGTDVLKALALGANAVLIGRPYLYGLAADGQNGVTRVLQILQREFLMAMALSGRTSISEIDRSVLWD